MHASWLNQVEIYISIIQKKILTPNAFVTLDAVRVRIAITVEGVVQGVGFRPFIVGLAERLDLGDYVENRTGIVTIQVEGEPAALDCFMTQLVVHAPPLARIDRISSSFQAAAYALQ
jgi:acylphosphatase